MRIEFSPPFVDQDVIDEVINSLKSGWITSGPKVKALENELKLMTGTGAVVCVNSWTSGAIAVLKWYGVGPGDEVIIPAYTYSATALAVLHCGATPVLVDILGDFSIDVREVERLINDKTKAIIPVDFAGWPCDYNALNKLVTSSKIQSKFSPANDNQQKLGRILILADAAHSIGASIDGIQTGSLTDITVFSFHAVKNITTAEGGAICLNLPDPFNNDNLYEDFKLWTLNGQTKDAFAKLKGGGDSWRYDILFAGLKANLPDICASIGLSQIKKYMKSILPSRAFIAKRYNDFFSTQNWAECPVLEMHGRRSSYHIYPLRIRDITESQRNWLVNEISKKGINVNVHFIPLPMLTLFKDIGYKIDDFPSAYNNYSREISLPIYPGLSKEQIDFICEAVCELVKEL